MRARKSVVLSLVLCAPLLSVPLSGPAAAAGPFVVNTTDDLDFGSCDSYHCSLREAINLAGRNPGRDTINFDIPGPGPHVIQTHGSLIADSVVIDGTTQPGFAGKPVVRVIAEGRVPTAFALQAGSTLRSLDIRGFTSVAIYAYDNVVIQGSIIQNNSGVGIEVSGKDVLIGGPDPGDGNVIRNNVPGIMVDGNRAVVQGNLVEGNLLFAGRVAGIGIWDGINSLVGGTSPGEGNVIVANAGPGIQILGSYRNVVQGNFIGVRPDGSPAGNQQSGILIHSSNDNVIGGALGNVIAHNVPKGINIIGDFYSGTRHNVIRRNSIYGHRGLGINLGGGGVEPNDPGDADVGPNDLQNYPDLISATLEGEVLTIQGSLGSRPDRAYMLDFFANGACNRSGHGEGRKLLGSLLVRTGTDGTVNFTATFEPGVSGRFITATATANGGDTSEFSNCVDRNAA